MKEQNLVPQISDTFQTISKSQLAMGTQVSTGPGCLSTRQHKNLRDKNLKEIMEQRKPKLNMYVIAQMETKGPQERKGNNNTCSSTFMCLAKSLAGRHSFVNGFKPLIKPIIRSAHLYKKFSFSHNTQYFTVFLM